MMLETVDFNASKLSGCRNTVVPSGVSGIPIGPVIRTTAVSLQALIDDSLRMVSLI